MPYLDFSNSLLKKVFRTIDWCSLLKRISRSKRFTNLTSFHKSLHNASFLSCTLLSLLIISLRLTRKQKSILTQNINLYSESKFFRKLVVKVLNLNLGLSSLTFGKIVTDFEIKRELRYHN